MNRCDEAMAAPQPGGRVLLPDRKSGVLLSVDRWEQAGRRLHATTDPLEHPAQRGITRIFVNLISSELSTITGLFRPHLHSTPS